ncbi:MAG: preprotein translocase subunit YajC, partial [Fulvivirga sp.]|nr:preprotein translocase subunit YajC [Fulvivirga sp.]
METILLQADGGGGISSLLLFGGVALVFYFFMIRPQQKKQKEQKKFIEEIKRGDQVVTIGGVPVNVLSTYDATVLLYLYNGFKIKLQKTAVSLEASKKDDK